MIAFRLRPRQLMPALTTKIVAVPAKTRANVITSLETRVLNLVPKPSPLLLPLREHNQVSVLMRDLPDHPHPLGQAVPPISHLHRLGVPMPKAEKGQSAANLRDLHNTVLQTLPLEHNIPPTLMLDPTSLHPYDPSKVNVNHVPLMNITVPPLSIMTTKIDLCARQLMLVERVPGWYWARMSQVLSLVPPQIKSTNWRIGLTSFGTARTSLSRTALDALKSRGYSDLPLLQQFLTLGGYLGLMACLYFWDILSPLTGTSLEPLSLEDWCARYPLTRQEQLKQANDRVKTFGWKPAHLIVKNFLKIETSDNGTDPRNISPRSDEFLASVGPFVSALEHVCVDHPALVKGLDLVKRDMKLGGDLNPGCHFAEGLNCFSDFFETDYSRFDLSISAAFISVVERVFLASPFLGSPDFLRLLPWLVQTVGLNDLDLTYTVLGTRCSGDCHTSIMNGLINHFNTWLCLFNLPTGSWISFHEGDDALIASRSVSPDTIVHNLHLMPVLGFQLKLDVFTDVNLTSFCGRHLFNDDLVLSSHCDLLRSLVKFHTICADGDSQALLLAKSLSYYYTDKHTPVVGTLCHVIISLLLPVVNPRRLRRAMSHLMSDFWFRETHSGFVYLDTYPRVKPTPHCRLSVSTRSGITVDHQIELERYYMSWLTLGYLPSKITPILLDSTFKVNMHVFDNVAC